MVYCNNFANGVQRAWLTFYDWLRSVRHRYMLPISRGGHYEI